MIISFLLCSPENGTVHFFPAATIAFGTYTASSLSIYLLIDILFACMSWLLSILLQCMFACLCLFYSGILTVSAHQGIGRIIWQLNVYLLKAPLFCFPQWLFPGQVPLKVEGMYFFPAPSALILCRLFNDGYSHWCEVVPHCSFNLLFSNISDDEHLFILGQGFLI